MLTRLLESWLVNGTYELIITGKRPALIACIRRDGCYTLGELKEIAEYFHDELEVYYALEDLFPFFSQTYGVSGTPTFLLIHEGRIIGTILGKEPVQELIRHASIMLLEYEMSVSARILDNKRSIKEEKVHGKK